jgi:hypothetical protein
MRISAWAVLAAVLVCSVAAMPETPQESNAGRGWWDYARGPQVSCYRTADDFMHELREQGSVVVHCPSNCNGMFEGNLYGSNPYWMHSSICPAAIHAGIITRDGGKVLMEWAGEVASFPRSISNGVMSWQRVTPGRAFALKKWQLPQAATSSPSATGPACVLEMEVSYSADTFLEKNSSTSSHCCLMCDANIECMAWTFDPKRKVCKYKRHIGSRIMLKGAVSGLPISVQSPSHPLTRTTKYSPLTHNDGTIMKYAGRKMREPPRAVLGGRANPQYMRRERARKMREYRNNRRWAQKNWYRNNYRYPARPAKEYQAQWQPGWGHTSTGPNVPRKGHIMRPQADEVGGPEGNMRFMSKIVHKNWPKKFAHPPWHAEWDGEGPVHLHYEPNPNLPVQRQPIQPVQPAHMHYQQVFRRQG